MEHFDQLFVNGTILTMHQRQRVHAAGVRAGKVVATGEESDLRNACSPRTEVIDLEGRTMVPGFEDAHAHIWKLGQLLTSALDLRSSSSIAEIGAQLRERDALLPKGAWLLGRGFNEITLAEGRRPTRHDLDEFVPDRPILLTRTCGHIFVANTPALRLADIDAHTESPRGGIIERGPDGEPSGIVHETAVGLVNRVVPVPTEDDYRAMITAALKRQLALGITSSSDCGVLPGLLETYLKMDADKTLPARMSVMPLGRPDGSSGPITLPGRYRSPMLRIDTVKFLADGGLSGGTAALSVPYRNSHACGVTRFQSSDLMELFVSAERLGWRIATHAIGDAAIQQVLSLYENLPAGACKGRHRIEHVGLASASQLRRMARIGVMAVTQPIFIDELGANFLSCVPSDLEQRVYPIRDMIDAGLTVAFSSDAPVVQNDAPLAGVQAAVLRRTAEGECILPYQGVTAEEALYAYTAGSAAAAGEDQCRGSIQTGRWADFAVLSADPTAIEPEQIGKISVEQTYLAGKLVYSASN